jgi:hypothetical protein
MLLKALYQALGVKARMALVRSFGADPVSSRLYRPELYGYALLRVEVGGKAIWLDPTMRLTPFGLLPGPVRGCEALILPEPGEAPEVTRTPETGADGREISIALSIAPDGSGTVEGTERYLGFEGTAAKGSLEQMDAASRRQMMEQALSQTFRGLALETVNVSGEQTPGDPLSIQYRLRVPHVARVEGGQVILDGPLFAARLGPRYLSRAARETPLLLGADQRVTMHLAISVPRGTRLSAGSDANLSSEFGSFSRTSRQDGDKVVREDRFFLRRGRIMPGNYADFARFAQGVDEAQAQPMVFATPAAPVTP